VTAQGFQLCHDGTGGGLVDAAQVLNPVSASLRTRLVRDYAKPMQARRVDSERSAESGPC
jgi:hypothetical protein